ncbi:hypothetical protein V8E54_012794 [Elaphomyces granulatus]
MLLFSYTFEESSVILLKILDLEVNCQVVISQWEYPAAEAASPVVDRSRTFDEPLSDIIALTRRPSSPMDIFRILTPRSNPTSAGQGSINPNNINMQGLLALFAIIGASFVLAGIWFFFFAKNGGFVWRKGDWEEYKSTVLRRKGSDGKTLGNATKSTDLGGGSIVGRDYQDDVTFTEGSVTDMTETATTVTEEKPKRKRRLKETAKQKLLRNRKEEKWEGAADNDMRAYRQEEPARVGGLNREADGTYTGTEFTSTESPSTYNRSEPVDDNQRSVTGFSFTAGSADVLSQVTEEVTEEHHLRDPSSHRHQHRRSHRSRQSSPRKRERYSTPGGYTEALDFSSRGTNSEYQYSSVDLDDGTGTKAYHHPIPGLSHGYRRDGDRSRRRDSLSDSEG